MKYVIIGAGGTGGMLGFSISKAGKDVTLIARGEHLRRMCQDGLKLERTWNDTKDICDVKAMTMDEYTSAVETGSEAERPDVILVCVKYYSLADTIPFIKKVAKAQTIVIPILNVYGTGGRMQKQLPDILVTDGCIYVSAYIKEPGTLLQNAPVLRVVYGVREPAEYRPQLETIAEDLKECGIDAILSKNIRRDALKKFSYVSPAGAAGLCCNATSDDFLKEGDARNLFIAMIGEISELARAMGVPFEKDMTAVNLKIVETLQPKTTTSMQRDVEKGKPSEADGLICEVVRMGKEYGVPTPAYDRAEKMAREMGIV